MVEMNIIPWSPVLRYATPLPMNRTPVSTVALQHKSVSSVLQYATPLPMNTTTHSVLTQPVGFHAFCCLPMNTTTHSVLTQPRCLPMNMTHSVASP